ncbi:alpha/beta hydrolase [Ralstonia pseudosolanacearum]|uniref:alpha/beta hydrolase n=1 Tax=Ralstonia pseudosolanacearum TaxID=1310165 RepID=UPI001433083E|nr:alpha/beta fold hydrolase [Ralstonia pseudosolanacearum]MDO3518699.1 alpha/beta fold hydrolase [Ralstonia pseudosolanacearum]MDO3544657.1 alpha/beta fold hydrolase [Ralstonia pseudosolanacearum]
MFGTNRKPQFDATGKVLIGFSEARDDYLHFGRVWVDIPAGHQVGSLGGERGPWFRKEPELKFHSIEPSTDRWSFITMAQQQLAKVSGAQGSYVVVFIHGFNNGFEDAARRAAQLGADLEVPPSNMFFFSWPSRGRTPDYTFDEATIDASEVHLRSYLQTVIKIADGRKVHLIAHSMGNRALLRVISTSTSALGAQGMRFGQIILAAADVDRDLFAQLAPSYLAVSDRTTVYLSPYDFAVEQSQLVHNAPRAGCGTAPQVVISGIDNVVSTEPESFPYHAYFAETLPMMRDIKSLILTNTPARNGNGWTSKDGYWLAGPAIQKSKVLCWTRNTVTVQLGTKN